MKTPTNVLTKKGGNAHLWLSIHHVSLMNVLVFKLMKRNAKRLRFDCHAFAFLRQTAHRNHASINGQLITNSTIYSVGASWNFVLMTHLSSLPHLVSAAARISNLKSKALFEIGMKTMTTSTLTEHRAALGALSFKIIRSVKPHVRFSI